MPQEKFHTQEKEHGQRIKLLSYDSSYLLNMADILQLALKNKGLNAERIALPISRAPQEQKIDWFSEYSNLKRMEDFAPEEQEALKVRFHKFKHAVMESFARDSHIKGAFEKLFESDQLPDENGDAYEPWIWANGEDFTIIWGAYRAKDEIVIIGDPKPPPQPPPVGKKGRGEEGGEGGGDVPPPIKGCTDAKALNYNPEATQDDGSCIYTPPPPPVKGCTDEKALNYDPEATQDDGSCMYPTSEHTSSWFNNWFWFWVALALALLLAIWLVGCPTCEYQVSAISGERINNPAPEILPERPNQLVPINPDEDALDSTFQSLVLNRINLYPKTADADFEKFIRDTKRLCPDSSAKVTYWDPLTKRIQLDFDQLAYPNMISTMKEMLSDYDPLIWNEMLFQSSTINDPIYSDTDRGWHFKAISFMPEHVLLGNPQIKIAIVDDGFDTKHEDFSLFSEQGFDFFHHQATVYGKTNGTDQYGEPIGNTHGTHVSGICSAQPNNKKGALGLSPNCSIIPVQISDEWSDLMPSSVIVDAILYSINKGAKVINLSLGLPMTNEQWSSFSDLEKASWYADTEDQASFWKELYTLGEEQGVVFVKAAGNSNLPIEIGPMCRSKLPIYVMASNRQNQLAEFSNWVDDDLGYTSMAAPGVEIFSSIPEDQYYPYSGTSMSAPMVSSLIALMLSKDAALSPEEIRSVIEKEQKTKFAHKVNAPLLNFESVLERMDIHL